jgi:hypothetical protein
MAIFDLFSKRRKRERGETPDVYVYESIPADLRVQIAHVITDALGVDGYSYSAASGAYKFLHDTLAREYGLFRLGGQYDEPAQALMNFFLQTTDHERALDVIELSFRYIERVAPTSDYRYKTNPRVTADEAISELNSRFREHGVGYQFDGGEIVRVDSQFVHAEAVKPVLTLLHNDKYRAAETEFRRAHDHYRHERFEEAMTDCLKSLESVLKIICRARKWTFDDNDTAKKLLDIVFVQNLIPSYLQSEFTALRATLESGVPTVRNKQAAHGQGAVVRVVPRHLVSYVLHLTAASILFLVEADAAK